MGISRALWLEACLEAGLSADPATGDADALTIPDLSQLLSISERSARDYVRRLVACGRAIRTRKAGVRDVMGRLQHSPAYVLVNKPGSAGPMPAYQTVNDATRKERARRLKVARTSEAISYATRELARARQKVGRKRRVSRAWRLDSKRKG